MSTEVPEVPPGAAQEPERSFGPSALATPANAITAGRLLAAPFVAVALQAGAPSWWATVLWTGVALTDGIDGWVARRQGSTRSGAFLDPLSDKVLVLGALAALVARGIFWWVPVALIAAREVAVSVWRSRAGRRGVSVPARRLAKAKTLIQELAIGSGSGAPCRVGPGRPGDLVGSGCRHSDHRLRLLPEQFMTICVLHT